MDEPFIFTDSDLYAEYRFIEKLDEVLSQDSGLF